MISCIVCAFSVLGQNSQERRFLSASPTLFVMQESGVKEKMDIKDIQSTLDPCQRPKRKD